MKKLVYLIIFFLYSTVMNAQLKDLVQYVNTLQGTDSNFGLSYGNTYPTTGMPYGMHMWSAQTGKNGDGFKYMYAVDKIRAFSQSHQCSPWVSDYAVYSFMPMVGELVVNQDARATKFSHDNEIAKPHYYKVTFDNGITTEMAPTTRGVHLRFSYPTTGDAYLVLDGYTDMSEIKIDPAKRQISGWVNNQRFVNDSKSFRNYFVVQFDKPMDALNGWVGDRKETDINSLIGSPELITVPKSSFKQSPSSGVEACFGSFKAGDELLLKTAISYVSEENARENIERECKHWDFDQVKSASERIWNEWLGKIDVQGGSFQQKTKFYTDLWHVLLGRHKIDDSNGEYPDYLSGGERIGKQTRIHTIAPKFQVRTLPKDKTGKSRFHMYNSDAIWLTQWNLNTLWGLAYPSVLDEFSASFIEYDKNGGLLPRGPSIGSYTYIMTGCPATSLITSAYQRGVFHKWLPKEGYAAMKRNHEKGGMLAFDMDKELEFYIKHGYCPEEAGLTIQWAFEDWALGEMAKAMGKLKDYNYYRNRSLGWPASWHPDLRLMMPRKETGEWVHLDPLSERGFVQANAWQATFGLSHDIETLARLMGGNDSLATQLNYVFEMSKNARFLSSYVSYATQPGCSNAHVFSHVGKPWLTQYWVRQVAKQTYGDITPERGYGENDEDQGQMAGISALMAMGLFSLDGGSAYNPMYDITSPVFNEITIRLDSRYYKGNEFKIKVHDNSPENCYIQKASLNGEMYHKYQLPHTVFEQGGLLELWLGDKPNKEWGTQ